MVGGVDAEHEPVDRIPRAGQPVELLDVLRRGALRPPERAAASPTPPCRTPTRRRGAAHRTRAGIPRPRPDRRGV